MPWFKNELSVSSTDVLELRAICDSTFVDEDIVIASYAIYVSKSIVLYYCCLYLVMLIEAANTCS